MERKISPFESVIIPLQIDGVVLEISAIYRMGKKPPLVFLHGFGSTKEDYADIIFCEELNDHGFIAYDFPGCGETICAVLEAISIGFFVKTALAVLEHFDVEKFHLLGHSMGGLTSLILADQNKERVLSFTDIEGNIAPEDCFLSRQIINYPADSAKEFFDNFIARTRHATDYASALYSASLRHKVRAEAVKPIFTSMVDLSDNGELMDKFLGLPCPVMFMFGEQNRSLSYLPHIEAEGVMLAEVPNCGHFPMYSNPACMWKFISENIQRTLIAE
ncbi:alpha/beta fold hydrolase [Vibrio sp. SCSIO 43137]|uniref:alpha/beta fold hydrolase n=1 Tax=Vibrio sp. SCSIO 43137 TaxID=3021011 RepID=UPI002307823E|nr:alpha/beta hydrolase [Vibrio sp. SCSIO 43137]WCE28754.1 alpha/beta hydrolase [Vibrio sp. SCSIO 43137]